MAVSINNVYQRVLAALNKENMGYLTPQEFNLFANQAKNEIFEQYFFDLNQYGRMKDNNTEYARLYDFIDEKLSIFKVQGDATYASGLFTLPSDLYKLGTVIYNYRPVEAVDQPTLLKYLASRLTQPSEANPIYTKDKEAGKIQVYPSTIQAGVACTYVKSPVTVAWGYTSVLGEAIYDAGSTTDFDLHESEEVSLTLKILGYAGLSIKDATSIQAADAKETKITTQEKS